MARIRRGAAHCRASDCPESAKLVPLLPFVVDFNCPRCGRSAAIEAEFGTGLGTSQHYNEVRVYFSFDPKTRTYTEFTAAEDESLFGQHSAYAFFTPLVRDREEAERIARMLLTRLNGERKAPGTHGHASREQLESEGWRVAS